ncbi:uncharacterized protein YlaI [Nocardioides kongjuensis]|uniref:Uncharacterized protein YlaI n=1 Tax=Nocardioides kongjuensis TaxID=349522 RepID=A0A852RQ81_9ACTN|nr:uncharacterized protein YlaI [Nocardioides kongjuensis]
MDPALTELPQGTRFEFGVALTTAQGNLPLIGLPVRAPLMFIERSCLHTVSGATRELDGRLHASICSPRSRSAFYVSSPVSAAQWWRPLCVGNKSRIDKRTAQRPGIGVRSRRVVAVEDSQFEAIGLDTNPRVAFMCEPAEACKSNVLVRTTKIAGGSTFAGGSFTLDLRSTAVTLPSPPSFDRDDIRLTDRGCDTTTPIATSKRTSRLRPRPSSPCPIRAWSADEGSPTASRSATPLVTGSGRSTRSPSAAEGPRSHPPSEGSGDGWRFAQ